MRSVGEKSIASRRRAVNSIVNGQWLIVMRGIRYPNATLCHSERSEESREEKNEILRFALNDKLMVNGQLLIVMRGTRRIMKLMVNGQWLIVMPGTRNPNATLCHSERSEESRGEKGRDSSLTL